MKLNLAPMTIKFSAEVKDKPKDEESKQDATQAEEQKPESKTKVAPS